MLSPSATLTKPITITGNKYVPPHLRKSQGSGASNTNNNNPEETRPSYSRNYSSSSSFGSGRGGNRSGGYDRSYQDNRSSINSTASSRWNVDTSEPTRSNGAPPSSSFATSRGMSNTNRTNARGFHGDMTPDKRLEQRLFSQKDHQTTGINFDNYDKIPCEISGENVPDPIEVYTTETIGDDLFRNTQLCHYTRPTPVQKYSIPIGQQGRDLMACAQTGSGKTAGFLFPIIMSMIKAGGQESPDPGRRRTTFPEALVLAPTRELAQQIYEEAVRFTYCTGIACVCIYGGADIRDQLRQIERGCDLLVATPGRLVDLIERGRIAMDNVRFLVLDEADRMLDMGFEPQIRRIVQEEGMPSGDGRQTMMFSATFPHNIQRLASDFMREYVFLTVGRVGSASKDVTQTVEYVEERSKIDVLMKFLLTIEDGLILIFVETKRSCDYIEDVLCRNHFPACSIHGDKSQSEREEALRSFKRGDTPVMVGTDVASRGLDIPNVTQVVNYDLPSSIDDYVHRIGRTGRAGNTGSALSFINEKNIGIVRELRDMLAENDQVVPAWLDQMARATGFGGGKSGGRGGRSGGRGGGRGGGGNFGSRDVRYAQNSSGGGGRDNQHRGNSGGGYGGSGYGGGNTVGQFGDGAW